MDFQATLFESTPLDAASLVATRRTALAKGAWVDVRRDWLTDADDVFATMVHDVPWRAERRQMYDRVVDVPRLVHQYAVGEPLPHPTLVAAREVLSEHYRPTLGGPFVTAGCCFYRDGGDSVAWHSDRRVRAPRPDGQASTAPGRSFAEGGDGSDRIGRGDHEDTLIAIVSLGDPRRLALRPRGGGASLSFTMSHGDLLVMGGSCQRTWEHAVPKVVHAGPRISVQFRPLNVF